MKIKRFAYKLLSAAGIIINPATSENQTNGSQLVGQVDPNDSTRRGEFDNLFQVPVIQTIGHHEIHEEDTFTCGATDTSMVDSEVIMIAFKSGSGTKRMHLLYDFASKAGGHIDLYKNSTWDAETGTLLPIYNSFQKPTTKASTVLENQAQAGFVASGNMILNPNNVVLGQKVMPSDYAFGAVKSPAGSRAENERIIQVDTQHVACYTADGNSNAGQLHLEWYEHTDS